MTECGCGNDGPVCHVGPVLTDEEALEREFEALRMAEQDAGEMWEET